MVAPFSSQFKKDNATMEVELRMGDFVGPILTSADGDESKVLNSSTAHEFYCKPVGSAGTDMRKSLCLRHNMLTADGLKLDLSNGLNETANEIMTGKWDGNDGGGRGAGGARRTVTNAESEFEARRRKLWQEAINRG